MANIKVGLAGLRNQTPAALKVSYRTLMGLVAIWAIIQPAFPEIPEHTVSVINRICALVTPLYYAVCQMVGVEKKAYE